MKTKLTLLAAALVVGFSATTATANPWKGLPFMPVAKPIAPAKPALNSCCENKTRYTTTGIKNGIVVNKSVECNTGCPVPHAGKSCSRSERKACAN